MGQGSLSFNDIGISVHVVSGELIFPFINYPLGFAFTSLIIFGSTRRPQCLVQVTFPDYFAISAEETPAD